MQGDGCVCEKGGAGGGDGRTIGGAGGDGAGGIVFVDDGGIAPEEVVGATGVDDGEVVFFNSRTKV